MTTVILESADHQEDYYQVLGCSEHSSTEQILKEYKLKAIKYHPDKCNQDSPTNNTKFQIIQRAKEVLIDPEKRKCYDLWRQSCLPVSFETWLSKHDLIKSSMHFVPQKKMNPMLHHTGQCTSNSSDVKTKQSNTDLLKKFRNYEI